MKPAIASSPQSEILRRTPTSFALLTAARRQRQAEKQRQNGVTLLELIVALAIVAMTLTMGVPNVQKFIASNRVTAQANTLLGALSIARSEAIKRNNVVVVARANGSWQDGWTIFVDLDADGNFDSGDTPPETQIQTQEAIDTGYPIQPNGYADRVSYRPDGRVSTPGSFDICSSSSDADFRQVIVAATGRVRVATPESSDDTYAEACSS